MSNVKVTFAGNAVTIAGNPLKVGDVAPDFTCVGPDLKPISLSDFKGKNIVLAVYPSIDTGICALQNKRFNKIATEHNNVVVLSISLDLPFAQKRFCAAEGLNNIHTLSDYRDREFGLKYGFLINELKLLTRATVVIDSKGIIRYLEYVPEVTTEPDYDKALSAINAL